jgi:hypothetical protein
VDARRVEPDRILAMYVSQTVTEDWRARLVRAWYASGREVVAPEIRQAVEAL